MAELTTQVPNLPVELLPQPAWNLFVELQAQAEQLGAANERCENVDEPEYLDAFLGKHGQLDEAHGSLATYGPIFDAFDSDFSAYSNPVTAKYRAVRKILARGVALLHLDHDRLSGEGISPENVQLAIDEAFRLTDAENALWEFIGSDIFRPDDWKANRDALAPLKLLRPQIMNFELRMGVMELSHAFVLGQWISVQALSRALLEQAVKLNCERLDIDLTYTDAKKMVCRKSLHTLIEDLGAHFPDIVREMGVVKEHGNRVLHVDYGRAGQRIQVGSMATMREDAIRSIRSLYQVLEALPKLAR